MLCNRVANTTTQQEPTCISVEKNGPIWKWETDIDDEVKRALKVFTCSAYSLADKDINDREKRCPCGRLARRHSFNGTAKRQDAKGQFSAKYVDPLNYTMYGLLDNGSKFIRYYVEQRDVFTPLYKVIEKDVGGKPDLLIGCFGGAKYFTMTDNLEKEFMTGISQAAATKGVWLLTTGLNNGVSQLIGQSVHRNKVLDANNFNPTLIGLTGWRTVTEHTRDVLRCRMPSTKEYTEFISAHFPHGTAPTALNYEEEETLDNNHSHFLLLDNGSVGGSDYDRYITDDERFDFVEKARKEFKCQSITIIIDGGPFSIQVIINDIKAKRPVIIIHHSGRFANVLGTLLEIANEGIIPAETDIKRQIEAFVSEESFKSPEEKGQIIGRIQTMFKPEYRKFLSVFHLERDSSLTGVIFQALEAGKVICTSCIHSIKR